LFFGDLNKMSDLNNQVKINILVYLRKDYGILNYIASLYNETVLKI
jgi:hypothetical protein